MKDLPENWKEGFTHPWQIGCGGDETPFIYCNQWWLYVWNTADEKHCYYNFADDMFYDKKA